MSYPKTLLRVQGLGLIAVTACACLMALYGWYVLPKAALSLFFYTLGIGTPVLLFYLAPAYALLHRNQRVTWTRVLALGVLPGVAASLASADLGTLLIVGGAFVAVATHLLSRWMLGKC